MTPKLKTTTISPKICGLLHYEVTGYYYEIDGYLFRKYLNIINKNTKENNPNIIPDLMVIMMNPGSSYPINKNNNGRIETPAKPDATQSQIMKVMDDCGFNYARILNLSDLREHESKVLLSNIKRFDYKGIPHSIFDELRDADFNELFVKNIPVIFACGAYTELKKYAQKAMGKIKSKSPKCIIGLCKNDYDDNFVLRKIINYDWAFFHPLPHNKNKHQIWVDQIKAQMRVQDICNCKNQTN